MKKLKSLCAIVGITSMLYVAPLFATEQKPEQRFDVPEYTIKEVEGITVVDDETGKIVKYTFDKNKDGKTDLVLIEAEEKECKYVYKGKEFISPPKKTMILYIDDNFDGYLDRILVDSKDKNERLGADGVFDYELKTTDSEILMKKYSGGVKDERQKD